MNKSTLATVIVVAGVALAGYLVYKHYQIAANTNTIGGGVGSGGWNLGGNLNLNTLVGDLGALFGGGSTNADNSGD
jgi:hypothetical protein